MNRFQDFYLPFLLGFLNFVNFKSFGQLILIELIAVVLFVIIKILFLSESKYQYGKEIRYIFYLGFLWLLGVLLSDYYAHSVRIETSKSVAQILVLLVLLFWVFTWLIQNKNRVTFYIIGFIFSSIPAYFFSPGIYDQLETWKFIVGPNLTLLLFLFIGRMKFNQMTTYCLIVGLASIDLILGSRSLALITLITLSTYRTTPLTKNKIFGTIIMVIIAGISLYSLNFIYSNLAMQGKLGLNQQIKYLQQSQAGPILLSGRSELVYELGAISETRFLGLGSDPYLNSSILEKTFLMENKLGVEHNSTTAYLDYTFNGKIPSHSIIFSMWFEGGVLAGFFWIYILFITFRWFMKIPTVSQPFGLLSKYLAIQLFWTVLFSPLGAGTRVVMAFSLGIIFLQSRLQSI